MEELLDIVNEADEVIGKASREETYTGQLIYRSAWVIVEDEIGNILLQLRAKSKDTFPGYWDISAAGHVDAGEDYLVAAKRELKEELGISNVRLHEIDYDRFKASEGKKNLDRFCKVYKTIIPANTKLHLQKDEVARIKWLSPAEVIKLPRVHPDLLEILKRHYQM
jgi:16S rRNA (adenine1518-N6/adenine1519-N6)-dimethyltransferase